MSKCIVCKKSDGTVSVIYPAQQDDEFINMVLSKDVPKDVVTTAIVDSSDLPDRYFRNSWELDNSTLIVNEVKAKAQKLKEIRELRNSKLAELDAEQLKLQSQDKSIDDIKIKKQELRDLPENIKFPKLDNLRDFIPQELQD